jgi:hypothetical protein
MNRKAFFPRDEAWTFSDGPALQRAVELKTQVIVQAPRRVLVDHEALPRLSGTSA